MNLRTLNPAVPRGYLFALAGALWTVAGAILCIRGEVWLEVFPFRTEFALESMSVACAALAYIFLFASVVQRNIDRIDRLPDRACIFAFAAWKGYAIIAVMMTLGIWLRNSDLPKYYLSIPYTAMGIILLAGSIRFYRRFLTLARQNKR